MDITYCPECGAPAEVLWRADLEGTSGPVEHAKVLCLNRHAFFLPAETLWTPEPPKRPEVEAAAAHRRQGDHDRNEGEEVTGPTLEEDREGRDAQHGHRQDQHLSPRRPTP